MKILRFILISTATWVLWLVVSQYLFCARFAFNSPAPFEGSAIYNPYETTNQNDWIKCNFHAHAHAWQGITNGHGNAMQVHQAYDSLGYGVHCVSNYHEIDTTFSRKESYIPAYEHGYNLRKTHQLVLGGKEVKWLDYLLPQTIHNKQHVLNSLKEDPDALVILNHPGMRNGYTEEDLAGLTNFECMEVLNPAATSERQWDAALSSGKKVFIAANDDLHNVVDKERFGVICTIVNAESNGRRLVLDALKNGKSYGVKLGKTQHPDSIPTLKYLTVNQGIIEMKLNAVAREIAFTGQNGKILATFENTDSTRYLLKTDDHYARATVTYQNGTTLFLNPVFFTKPGGYRDVPVYIDVQETLFFRSVGITVLAIWFIVLFRLMAGNQGWGGNANMPVLFPWKRMLRKRSDIQTSKGRA